MPHKCHNAALTAFVLASAAFLFATNFAHARNVTLTWDPSSDPSVAGYTLFYGTSSGNYTQSINTGNATSAILTSLTEGSTYFIVVTAYNSLGLHSVPSNEVSFTAPANAPPTVRLTSPLPGDSLDGSNPIALAADASDPDGSITKVEFYEGANKIGQATAAPYTSSWNNAPAGNYSLTALAYDDSGAAVRSMPVAMTVVGTAPAPNPSPSATPAAKIHVLAVNTDITAGANARFKIVSSNADPSQPTVVTYTIAGSADPNVDYDQSDAPGQLTIPAGSRSAVLAITTKSSPGSSKNKNLAVVLSANPQYKLGLKRAVVVIKPR